MKTLQLVLGLSLLSFVSTSALASPAHKAGVKHKAAQTSPSSKGSKKSSKRAGRSSHASKSAAKRPKHASLVKPSDKQLMQPKWL
jgi:hypothetical protein